MHTLCTRYAHLRIRVLHEGVNAGTSFLLLTRARALLLLLTLEGFEARVTDTSNTIATH